MLFKSSLCLAVAATASAAVTVPNFGQSAIDSGSALSALGAIALGKALGNLKGSCNAGNVKIRQEWRTLSAAKRKNYIAAVKCMLAKPSAYPASEIPGAMSSYDDFEVVHINQTMNIHLTGNFLTWHRYYIHVFEEKLKACGYTGNLPYWEWGFDVKNPRDSPVFDGSETSLGGDGAQIDHLPLILTNPNATVSVSLAPGTGGGCIASGPFKNMTTHLGPVNLPVYGQNGVFTSSPTGNPYDNNPRCVKRDLNPDAAQRFTTFRNTTELILQNTDIKWFQGVLQGDARFTLDGGLGVHGGGHFQIGGDPGGDAFVSPGDPAFFLHHAQVDRIYWIWQNLDFKNRQKVWGTNFFFEIAPAPNTTVDDLLAIEPLSARTPKIKDVMNAGGGTPLCYVYI